jgi:cell division septation protein DedD
MKKSNSTVPDLDLEALEHEIAAAVSAKQAVPALKSDDPFAELARIMGQDSPFAGLDTARSAQRSVTPAGMSLDDILNAPPSAGLRRYEGESLSDSALDQPAMIVRPASPEIKAAEIDEDEVENIDELSDDEGAPLTSDAIKTAASLEDEEDLFENQGTESADDVDGLSEALERAKETLAVDELPAVTPPAAAAIKSAAQPQFDDMLAEFESAMRDVGSEKIATVNTPSLEPITVPPPPEELYRPQMSDTNTQTSTGFGASGLAGAAAAGAAIIAASSMASSMTGSTATSMEEPAAQVVRRPRRGLMIAGGVIGIAVIGIFALFAFGGGSKKNTGGAAPVIEAKSGVTKERPANPGGVDVPNQDKEILKAPGAASATPDRVVPREEQPVDLKQAQTAAATLPVVRQIPGVAVTPQADVAVPATPASPSVAGSQPVPRPVASVPISIAGQPAASQPAPVATVPAAPATPVSAAPATLTLVPTPAPVVPTPAPVAAAPVNPAQAAPRKVRTVPIRDGETAPTRTAAQPRIAPAAPRTAPAEEADATNAPLRITPQALRGTQRVAATAPAETATQSAPAQPVRAQPATASGGSGFSVQLGAEGSQDSARAKFNRVKGQHSDVLGDQNANIRTAEVNGRSVYRIRVGNMTRQDAVGLCERLKADGGSCFVAKN